MIKNKNGARWRASQFALAAFLATGAVGVARAQEAAPGASGADVDAAEEIVVIGSRLTREEALRAKQNDSRIIEALGADELGQLPDKNVGESLNRVPGVSMLVEKGEGRYVQIRGVAAQLNNVTINGVQMGSPEVELGGRQAPLDIISGGVLGAVQVIKTPTPDMDAQGIGGTVNVETKMPFDRPESLYGYASARYGYEEIRPESQGYGGHDPYAVDGTLSGKVGESIGWLVGGSYSAREYISLGIYQDDWTELASAPGTFLPTNVKNNYYVIGRERTNLNGALEFRPTDNDTFFVRGFYGEWNEFQHRNRYEQNLTGSKVTLTSDTSGAQGTDRVLANIRLEYADKIVSSFAAGGENVRGPFTLEYLLQFNHNEIREPNDSWEWRSGASAVGPSTFTIDSDGVTTITPNAGTPDRTSPALQPLRRIRFFESAMDEDARIAQVDLTWAMSDTLSFKTGVKFVETERALDQSQNEFTLASGQSLNLGSSPDFTSGGFVNEVEKGDAPNIWLNLDGMNAYFAANASQFVVNSAAAFASDFGADYDLTEQVVSAYGMGTSKLGPIEIIGGVRMEATDIDSSGYLRTTGSLSAQRINAGGDYTEWLPALLLNYRPAEDFVIRGAITRALGRPDFDQIAPRSTYGENGAIGTVSIGNPNLQARTSWNYDAAIEWYPNELSVLAASVFYKDISNQLTGDNRSFSTQTDMQAELTRLGLVGIDTSSLTRLDVGTTINAGEATLKGFELNAQTQLDFLPSPFDGFGVSATATWIEGEVTVNGVTGPLEGQPESTYDFTVFYQNGKIDASVSYSYNASYLTDNNADPDFRLDQGEFGRWDAKVLYSLNERAKLFLEGVNLNDEPTTEFQGGRSNWNTEYEYVGRTIYIGASYGF